MSVAADRPSRAAMTRRAALGVLGAGAVGYAIWPRRARSAVDVPPGRTVVTYWEKWTGPEGDAIQAIVDAFNAGQPEIWVRRVPVSDIVPKAMVAIAGGDAPDLVGLFNYNIPLFAEAGAVRPLAELGDAISEDAYTPGVRRLLMHEDAQWAGVATCHSLALYYNRRRFRDAGLDPDRPPRTVAELDACADALTTREGDRIVRAGFLPNIPFFWPYLWPILFGGSLYDDERDRATLAAPANVAAYTWAAGYAERYGVRATTAFAAGFGRSFNSLDDPFLAERVAMIVQGPWIANFIRRFAPDLDYGCVPVPVRADLLDPSRPAGMLEADVVMIPRGAAQPEAAYAFLRYLQRRDVQERLARLHCKGSPLREVSPSFGRDHPNPYVGVHDAIAASPRVTIAPPTRVWTQYAQMIGAAFDAIWSGAAVEPELRGVESRVQELLDTTRRRRELRRAGRSTP
jgi:ABC-type glycerol-3-phosphate transport system substrate-binding protein